MTSTSSKFKKLDAINGVQYLQLVGRAKCLQQIDRENIISLGKQSLAGILIG
jgi:hypothetical protein